MTEADKGFLIDLYRFQGEMIKRALTATAEEGDNEVVDNGELRDDGNAEEINNGAELARLAYELRVIGEAIPKGNDLMLQQIAKLNRRLDEFQAASPTRVEVPTTVSVAHRVNLVKLDSQLPNFKAARGENMEDCFFRIENWA